MKNVYFVHQDSQSVSRQSDGVELCLIPELDDNHIYFYCSEYSVFWKNIQDAGDFAKVFNFKPRRTIRPATLTEICERDLCGYINTVKQYSIEGGSLKGITYIHL